MVWPPSYRCVGWSVHSETATLYSREEPTKSYSCCKSRKYVLLFSVWASIGCTIVSLLWGFKKNNKAFWGSNASLKSGFWGTGIIGGTIENKTTFALHITYKGQTTSEVKKCPPPPTLNYIYYTIYIAVSKLRVKRCWIWISEDII